MRVRGAEVPNFNVRGLPNVSAGPMADADNFGAGNARQIGRLGGAVQDFGSEMLRQDQVRRKKEDDLAELAMTNEAHSMYADGYQAIYDQFKGEDSAKAPEEIKKFTKKIRDTVGKKAQNKHQQEAFGRSMAAFENNALVDALKYRDKQTALSEVQHLKAQNMLIAQDGARHVEGFDTPDGRAADMGRLAQMVGNTEKLYAHAPAEFRQVQVQNTKQVFHRAKMGAMERPEDALRYLDRNDVKDDLGPALVNNLREKYKEVQDKRKNDREDAEAELYAIDQYADGKGKNLLDLQPELIDKYGSDRGKLAYQAAVTRDSLIKSKEAQEAKQLSESRWNSYYETGKIPAGATRKERAAMMRDQTRKEKGLPGEDPWAFGQYLIDNFTPDQLKQMQRDGKWSEVYPKLLYNGKAVGVTKDVNDYIAGIKGAASPEKYARMQFIATTGIRPGTEAGAKEFNRFMDYFTEETEKRAGELKLDNVNQLPRDEQDKILANLLESGDYGYSWQWNYFSPDRYRFQVMNEEGYREYFYPKANQQYRRGRQMDGATVSSAAPYTGSSQADAAPYAGAGPRDTSTATASGGAEITTNQGVKQRVENGRIEVRRPTPAEEARLKGEMPEPETPPPEVRELLDKPGAVKNWTGDGWIITVPGEGISVWAADGTRMG